MQLLITVSAALRSLCNNSSLFFMGAHQMVCIADPTSPTTDICPLAHIDLHANERAIWKLTPDI